MQAKEKDLTEKRDRCKDATHKIRTGLRIFKIKETLLKMGDEGDQARREIVEAERLQFTKEINDDKQALKIYLAEQRVRVPNLSLFISHFISFPFLFLSVLSHPHTHLCSLCNG